MGRFLNRHGKTKIWRDRETNGKICRQAYKREQVQTNIQVDKYMARQANKQKNYQKKWRQTDKKTNINMESRQTKIWTQLGRWTDRQTDRPTKIWTQQKPDKIGTADKQKY